MLEIANTEEQAAMARAQARATRGDDSRSELETELDCLLNRHADHSLIRDALERMSGAEKQAVSYTTYPACQSNA